MTGDAWFDQYMPPPEPPPPSHPGWFDRNRGLYPDNWEELAGAIKAAAGWQCEACDHPHDPASGHTLTVDHVVDHNPANVALENLVALCQVCHLRRQGMVPRPRTKEEALRRLRHRSEMEHSQTVMEGFGYG